MALLRRVPIFGRLAVGFGLAAISIACVAFTAFTAAASASRSAHSLVATTQLVRDSEELRYQAANVKAWQNAYAFDVAQGIPDSAAATAPTRSQSARRRGSVSMW